ncbi:sugar phosphate isomerase/epimerase [Candidatus Woesearchaeota archaeon]|nr:sugar phosphate isomerase/epimerase [Candidatus Woesearchaeota archaeon]
MQFTDGYYGHHPMVDYFNSMDSGAYGQAPAGKDTDVELGIQDIGMSVPMGIAAQNVAGIYSKIRMGAGKLEIQFPGYRTGQRQSQTPGMFGEDQRQAMREMQMANEVRVTTHSSFGIMGMMGRDERGNFSSTGAYGDMQELQRAIDFQADMGGGGSVVVHSGEFERPMTDMHLDDETHQLNLARDPSGRLMVRQYHVQEFDAQFDLMDSRTSQKMETVQKDRLVAYPVWNKAKKDYSYIASPNDPSEQPEGTKVSVKEGDYVDYQNRKITDPEDPLKGKVPEYDPKTGRFNIQKRHFDYFKEAAEEYNEYKRKKDGKELNFSDKVYPEEMFLRATLETQEGHSRGWALQYGLQTQTHIDALNSIDKAIKYYKKLDASIPEEEKWKILKQESSSGLGRAIALIPPETKHPLKILEEARVDTERNLEFARQASAAQEQQALDTHETKENLITPIKRLEQHGVRMYAEAAIHAMQKTKDPNAPIVVAIENLFPERFGGHLEELKWVVKKSRERMVEFLTEPKIQLGVSRMPVGMTEEKLNEALTAGKTGMLQENPYYLGVSEEEAEKIAAKHIKITLDTGHLNMWRKYWQEDPKLSKEKNEETYKKWILGQVESLAKENMIGNVHMADNFGYQDDHLAPGQGNSPIKEVVAILKKHGYDKAYTVEPGADASTDLSDFHGLMKTWKHFGAPIYGVGMGGPQVPQNWSDVQYSYFGQNQPPHYIFGPYAPSNDWTMWSAVPLE